MRKLIWTITVLSLAAIAPAANAGQASKEEAVGVGTGAVLGAVAGGPVGFIIGSAIGAKIGETWHSKNSNIDELSASLDRSRDKVGSLELDVGALTADLNSMNADLRELERIAQPELINLLKAGIEMDLLFRTDEYTLADTAGARLLNFGQALAAMPDIQVQLDGFADERGATSYNQQLSQKRVTYVREQLQAAGVSAERISDAAHGEVSSTDQSLDSYALQRRVSLKVFIDDSNAFAANPR